MLLKSNKDLENFILNTDNYISFLIQELSKKGFECLDKNPLHIIDDIEKFYKSYYQFYNENDKCKLRYSFWAFFGKLLINNLGGKLQIAPKSDYCSGTPQLIDFGNRFDKKNKKKWLGIGFDSWFNGIIENKLLGSLDGTVKHIIEYYS